MTYTLIIIGSVLVLVGIYRFITSNEHQEELPNVVPTKEEIEKTPIVEEEPVVVVNNTVVEPKTEAPKSAPVKPVAKKKPYRKPKPKTPATDK